MRKREPTWYLPCSGSFINSAHGGDPISKKKGLRGTFVLTLSQFCQIPAANMVVCFQEDFPQTRLSDRVVFEVELVKPVEGILVGMHIQSVN